jgi:hypothetical protein
MSKVLTVKADTVVDVSAGAGSVFKFDAPKAGKLLLDSSYFVVEEAFQAAAVLGVASIEVGGVEVATYTSLGTEALDDSATLTEDGTVATAANPYAAFSAGDVLDVKLKTQATGGVGQNGTLRAYLAFELAD